MGEREVKSPWNSTPRPRANSGHTAGHVGKSASGPRSLSRRDQAEPVQGGGGTAPIEKAFAEGMRSDNRRR